jgi:hypothetical protein
VNEHGNFVLIVPLSCGAKILKIVLVLELVLIVGPKLFIEPGTKAISEAFERERTPDCE